MATPSIHIIAAIRQTAQRLAGSDAYQWGHMGLCNCGFLAQQVTHLRKDEIHARAMERHGDWSDQLNDYCPTSGLPIDDLITSMLSFGFDVEDLRHLERLSDGRVLRCLPFHRRALQHNVKADVITYLHTWAGLLERELLRHVGVPALHMATAEV